MNQEASSNITPTSQTAAPSEQVQPPSSSAPALNRRVSYIPWIIVAVLFVLILIMGGIILFTGSTGNSIKVIFREWLLEDETKSDSKSDNKEGDQDDSAETKDEIHDTEPDDTDNGGGSDSPADIAAGWSNYHNDSWYFGFKYPQDLTVVEEVASPALTVVSLKSGATTTVITVWIQSSGTMDNILANMLMNQCTDEVIYSNITYGTHPFRKALEVPFEGCMAGFGIIRDQELAAFGVNLPGEVILTIRNDGLNEEQLRAFLASVYAD